MPNATAKSVSLEISNLDKIVYSNSFCVYPNGVSFPIPFYNVDIPQFSVSLNFTSTDVVVTTGSDRSSANGFVTIYYTKTT